jgi:hypothetical protein
MKYKIEKNIEISPRGEISKVVIKMQPGDSIVVDTKQERDNFAAFCYKLNYDYATRKIPNTNKYRCWVRPEQDLAKKRKIKTPRTPRKLPEVLLGDEGFMTPSQISGDLPEDVEPRGTFPQEILNEAIQRAQEPFYARAFETNEWLEKRNDFKHHDSNGDGRPLDLND